MNAHFPLLFTTRIGKLPHLNMFYLELYPEIVQQLGAPTGVRLLCRVNGGPAFACGPVSLGNGSSYISINTQRMKAQGLRLGQEVEVVLEKDESKYGMEVPPELSELLAQDPEGAARFEGLSPGKQRYIIQYVSTVKSSQLRIDRAILLISNLKRLPVGKESFRAMLGLE
jgi:hypothetical protein